MKFRTCLALGATLSLFFASGCATRYQDLLRDRDAEIHDLKGELSNLRAENAELAREKASAVARLSDMQTVDTVDASTGQPSELAALDDLDGVDVRYDGGRISIGIENTVTFDSGKATLKSGADSVLSRVAGVLRSDFAGRRIFVEGHTDTDPIRKTKGLYRSNRHLSLERADAVAQHLVGRGGISERSIVVVGFGPHDPVDSGSGKAAKARNRRVEIVVGERL